VRLFCDIKNADGSHCPRDTRKVLKDAIAKAKLMKLDVSLGVKCEFYLFRTDDNGDPIRQTLDNGGYLDIAPLDKGENIRREICLNLQEMGLSPEKSMHKKGPGQNEIDFIAGNVLDSADNFLAFKAVVKAIASRNGLFASFMPKPLSGESGNGLHLSFSFSNESSVSSFAAGVLEKAAEMTAFLNPIVNSYERFGSFEAPHTVSWSPKNRSQLIRVSQRSMDLRSPDPSMNPYLAFALIIHAGISGIEKGLALPATDNPELLPQGLDGAAKLAMESKFIKSVLPSEIFETYIKLKSAEACELSGSDTQEQSLKRYFPFI
jgi:glutamine synthetase